MHTINLSDASFFEKKSNGVILRVKIETESKKTALKSSNNSYVTLSVQSKPEHGKANEEALSFLCGFFDVCRDRVKIVRGKKSRKKEVFIQGNLDDKLKEL